MNSPHIREVTESLSKSGADLGFPKEEEGCAKLGVSIVGAKKSGNCLIQLEVL